MRAALQPEGTGRRSSPWAAVVVGAALAAVTLLRLPAAWASGNALNHVSGAWMVLADDLARGTFYRPLLDPALGYGGTRFFPLTFALHAALRAAGLPLLAAGLLLSLAAGVLAAVAAGRFLRRAGHPALASAGLAPLVLCGFAGQHALAAVRGDLLAAALALWGLSALLPRARLAEAAALLTLAFAAKPTALAAALAGVAFLLLRGERRGALVLAAAVAAGGAAVVLATDLLSAGRFGAMLGALGAGGAGPAGVLHAPLRLADLLRREDPEGLAVLAAAGVAGLGGLFTWRAARGQGDPPGARALAALWVAASGLATLAVLASPGTGMNHLVELEAAAGLLVATCAGPVARASREGLRAGHAGKEARLAAVAVGVAGLAAAAFLWHRDLRESRLASLRAAAAAAAAGGGSGPLLSEDPLLPLLAGERPYAADPWMLRLAAARDPAMAAPLLAALRGGGFRAVVLLHDAEAPDAEAWFSGELGLPALAEIRRGWRRTFTAGPYFVYRHEARPLVHRGDPRPVIDGGAAAEAAFTGGR